MSLLTPQQPQQPSREQKLANRARMIKAFSAQAYRQICELQQRGIQLLWNDREFSPQELIDELGPDAIKIFQYHGGLTSYLVQVAQTDGVAPNVALPTNAFAVEDGVITVLDDTPYTP
jgi:hypothetical protein